MGNIKLFNITWSWGNYLRREKKKKK